MIIGRELGFWCKLGDHIVSGEEFDAKKQICKKCRDRILDEERFFPRHGDEDENQDDVTADYERD